MIFAHSLVLEFEKFYDNLYLICLPVRYFLSRLEGLFLWFLIAGFFSYNIMTIISLFVWFYSTYCVILFRRIWVLHRLSSPKLLITVMILFICATALGEGMRGAVVQHFYY